MHNQLRTQGGFSLVSVLMIMGMVLFSILMISQAKFRQQGTQRALKVKQSYGDVNQALMNSVVDIFHKKMSNGCLPGGWSALGSSGAPQDLDGRTTYYQTPNVGLSTSSDVPTKHSDAATRCRNPKSPGSPTNRFYFCLKIKPDASAPIDSILGAKVAFAEFAVELIDLQTQTPITCAQYTSRKNDRFPDNSPRDGSAGMAVTMALYWENAANATGGKSTFSQKALSYFANQN